ncbi:MAG: heavy-metal-associated domain-containing protein [Candidatus Neomarinimicrobiota bacterium]
MRTITTAFILGLAIIVSGCGKGKDQSEHQAMGDMQHDMSAGETAEVAHQAHAMVKLPTIQCDLCKERIESSLVKTAGIVSVTVDPEGHMGHINYDQDRLSQSDVELAIAAIGYQANETLADPEAYAALPDCCKVPE